VYIRAASERAIRWLFRSAFFSLLGGVLMMMRLGGGAATARLRWFLTVFVRISRD